MKTQPSSAGRAGLQDALPESRYRRLLLEAAIEEGYLVRLVKRSGAVSSTTRIVRPLELLPDPASPDACPNLKARVHALRDAVFEIESMDEVSVADALLAPEQRSGGGLTLGDPVLHPQLGPGVVQAFLGDGGVRVQIGGEGGARTPEVDGNELRVLRARRSDSPAQAASASGIRR